MNYHGKVLDEGEDFIAVDTAPTVPLVDMKLTLGTFGAIDVSMCALQARELARHLNEAADTLGARQHQ